MEDAEMDEGFKKCLEEKFIEIENSEKKTVINFVEELDLLQENKIQLEASQIYARNELEASEEYKSNKDQEVNKVNISNQIHELTSALINHRLMHNLAQKMMDNVKIQDAVFSSLSVMDIGETVDHYPERSEIFSAYSMNLEVSQKLVKVIDQTTQLDKDLLNQRVKYSSLLNQIKKKWLAIEKKSIDYYIDEDKIKSPSFIKLKEKYHVRLSKLRTLVTILQSLITCTGIDWGGNNRLILTLILCDRALSISKQTNLEEDITALQNARSQNSDEPRTSQSTINQPKLKLSDYKNKFN